MSTAAYPPPGTRFVAPPLNRDSNEGIDSMMKGGLLWLIGIPLPIILVIALFTNWLH